VPPPRGPGALEFPGAVAPSAPAEPDSPAGRRRHPEGTSTTCRPPLAGARRGRDTGTDPTRRWLDALAHPGRGGRIGARGPGRRLRGGTGPLRQSGGDRRARHPDHGGRPAHPGELRRPRAGHRRLPGEPRGERRRARRPGEGASRGRRRHHRHHPGRVRAAGPHHHRHRPRDRRRRHRHGTSRPGRAPGAPPRQRLPQGEPGRRRHGRHGAPRTPSPVSASSCPPRRRARARASRRRR